ncbi:hypothetical protein NP233_g10473 [Leucocoprinus birnbaumii]|uniref:Protein SMG7 n=1 Tax=Leucocoprinus birnbaumii TaxID=56174 RepID=A0AAD5VM01_9AGAR|nr:hypothetical protein NP233_g10473 [Leucocoprinus birnbaumii]
MTDQPAAIAREAKTLNNTLKELLKTKEPFDRDVDFQRKKRVLRKHYLNLLLVHPYAKESKDVENHLWMLTSYSFISSYKSRIAALDRQLQNSRHQQQQEQQRRQGGQQSAQQQIPQAAQAQAQGQRTNPHHGVVEHRKLVQRFRQFLAEEEKFWTLLVQRMYRTFGLTEAKPVLAELGLLGDTGEIAVANAQPVSAESGEINQQQSSGRTSNGRNHYQFPPESQDPTSLLPSAENRGSRLAIFTKALVSLGDIARYRELYNDSHGRPRAGHDTVTPAKRRNRRGQEIAPRARNYDKAQRCYDQAKLLVPNEGNSWHQLAILSSYQKNTFLMVVRYYRALCVSQPYDTATDNLNTVLSKALDAWMKRSRQEREKVFDVGTAPHVVTDTLRERIIVLHALWHLGAESGVEKMDSIGAKLDQLIQHDFNLLVSERKLLEETIAQIIVLSEGAFYKHRMIRPKTDLRPPANTSVLLDWRIIRHIYDLHSTLLDVGIAELKVPPPSDVDVGDDDKLALKITATFRRTLPGLRIAGKWLRANNGTLLKDPEYVAFTEEQKGKGFEVSKKYPEKISRHSAKTSDFWSRYVEFIVALSKAFPKTSLPGLTSPLDEDVDMRGFLPLRKLMGEENATDSPGSPEKPHPNAEQLMRIHDLLEDAKLLAALPNSFIKLARDRVVLNTELFEETQPEVDEIAAGEAATDEDVVEEAFRARDNGVLDDEYDDDDDEEIVYLQPQLSPVLKPAYSPPARVPAAHTVPGVPVQARPLTSPITLSPKSPGHPTRQAIPPQQQLPAPNAAHTITAEDLLKDVMLGTKTNETGFLQSIWSAASDEQSLKFAAGGSPPKSVYQSPRQYQADLPQPWSSSFPSGASHLTQQIPIRSVQNLQTLAQSPQLPPLASGLNSQHQHQRLPSLSSPYQHSSASKQPGLQESFTYSQLTRSQQQLPIVRPPQAEPLTPSFMSSPHLMNNPLFNNIIGQAPAAPGSETFGSPMVVGSTSPRYTSGGLHLRSQHGHLRQPSFGQSLQSPHNSQSNRPPIPGQTFTSMSQTW